MPLPEFTQQLIKSKLSSYCNKRVPPHVRDQIKLDFKIRGNSVTLFEQRRSLHKQDEWIDIPIAQFRYDTAESLWTLFCTDRNSKWHQYTPAKPSKDFNTLLLEVENDPTGIFWG